MKLEEIMRVAVRAKKGEARSEKQCVMKRKSQVKLILEVNGQV